MKVMPTQNCLFAVDKKLQGFLFFAVDPLLVFEDANFSINWLRYRDLARAWFVSALCHTCTVIIFTHDLASIFAANRMLHYAMFVKNYQFFLTRQNLTMDVFIIITLFGYTGIHYY